MTARISGVQALDLVQLAYQDWDSDAWRERLIANVQGLVAGARTTGMYEFTARPVPGGIALEVDGDIELVGEDSLPGSQRALLDATPSILESMIYPSGASTASERAGVGAEMAEWPQWRAMWRPPVMDALGLVFTDLSGHGVCMFSGLTATTNLSPRERALLAKTVAHLGAGYRLHRAKTSRPLEAAEAIFSSNGKVLHAAERAQIKSDALDDGRLRRDEARKTTHDPEKALEIWRGLVAGRWSLVDHFDTDGKRFLLAMKNAPSVDPRADLTPRERRVCSLAATGHRDKDISYMLGISLGSVTASMSRARKKLGITSRAELAGVWRAMELASRA